MTHKKQHALITPFIYTG